MLNREVEGFLHEVLSRENKTDLTYLIDGYALCARSEGRSPNYTSLVTTSVRFFTRYLKKNGLSTDVTKIGAQQIRGFVLHLQSVKRFAVHPFTKAQAGGLSGHSINGYLRSLRAFWHWLEAEGLIAANPFRQIKIPKAPEKVIPTFSEEQIKALLAQIDTSSPQGFRNYTIVLLLLDTMIRVSEITGCRTEHLNLENRTLRVWGKGSKERAVPFGKTVQRALWRYLTLCRPEPQIPSQDMLFLTADGRPMKKNRIETILKAYGQKAGLKGVRVSPHTFRHTGAVSFLRNGGDLFSLQRIMGHSSLEVLRRYIALSQADLARVHGKASPLDNLGLVMPRVHKGKVRKVTPGSGRPSEE